MSAASGDFGTRRRVVGFGSVTWDFCALVRDEPNMERTVLADAFKEAPGGQMGNTLRFLSRFGLGCQFRGHVGDDAYGRKILASLNEDNVDTAHLTLHKGAASRIVITFSNPGSGERGFVYRADSLGHLGFPSADLDTSDLILLGECDGRTLDVAEVAGARRIPCWFLGGRPDRAPEALLSLCEGIIVSREFVSAWRPDTPMERGLDELIALGPKFAVITDGSSGGLAWFEATRLRFEAYQVPAIDTSGAGDAFAAGAVFTLLSGKTKEEVLRFACACAAVNVRLLSASSAPQSIGEVFAFLASRPTGFGVSEVVGHAG